VLLDAFALFVDQRVREFGNSPVGVRAPELEGRGYLEVGFDQDQSCIVFFYKLKIHPAFI
jgi:hypothetical protein